MFKRSLAVMLVVLMAFSSVSICASAANTDSDFSDKPADSADFNYGITTKFFEKVGGNWVLSDGLVKRGDTVKARIYIENNYYTASSDFVFGYEKDFYSFDYPDTVTMNTKANQPALAHYTKARIYNSDKQRASLVNTLKKGGLITDTDVATYDFIGVAFEYELANPVVNFGDIDFETEGAWENKWAFEFDLTVNDDADSKLEGKTGDLKILPGVVMSTSNQLGFVNLPSAAEGVAATKTSDAYLWYAQTPVLEGDPQKVVTSITFFANGGTFGDSDTSEVITALNGDETAVADMYGHFGLAKPTHTGYNLVGWKEADENGAVIGTELLTKITVDGEDNYYAAVWESSTTTSSVDFYKNDGTTDLFASYTGTIGDAIVYSGKEPTREGYTFKGWSKQAENGTPETIPTAYPTANETYYAVWQLNNYNLQYYVPSDIVNNVFTVYGPAKNYGYGEDITLLSAPDSSLIPDGYYFLGWKIYDDDIKDYAEVPGTMPAEDVNVYALCVAKENPVTYYIDGKQLTALSLETDSAIPTDSASLFQSYEGPGYDSDYFDGWYVDTGCTVKLADGAVVPAGGTKLYAKTSIPATFYKETGDAEPYKVTYAPFMGEITVPATDPTKPDGTFTGWTPEPTIMDSATGKTFFGTWGDAYYTVSYYLSGSSVAAFTENVKCGEDFDAWEAPAKEGYTFNGWTWSEEGSPAAITKPAAMPAKNLVANGDYTVNQYDVIYKVDGKTVNTKKDIAFGTEIGDYTYKNSGYKDITEWNWSYTDERGNTVKLTAAPVTMPAYDLVAEAASIANVHTLTITYTGAGDATPAVYTKDVAYNTAYSVDSPAVTGYSADIATVSGTMPDSDVRKTVTYTPNNYTVSYKVDGADYQTPDTYAYGSNVTVKKEPTKTGYTFSGWTWKKADGADAAKPTTMPAYNLVAEGTFTVNKHDVVYKNDDGSTYAKFNDVPYGSDMPSVTPPTKEGYTFTGWTPAVPATVPDNDVEFTATFLVNTYSVTYKLNGGNISGNTADVTKNAEYNAAVPTVTDPTKDGFTFAGWAPAAPATMPAHNLEFTAQWNEVNPGNGNYTTKVYLMGTTGEYPATPNYSGTGSAAIGTKMDITELCKVDPTRYVLDTDKTNVLTGTISADTLNLVAYYKLKTATITWNANGGKIDDKDSKAEQVYIGSTVVAPTATKVGYTFDGWDKDVVSPATADATYTAKWKVNTNDVTYYNEDGSVKEKFPDVNYGDPVPAPTEKPTKEGYAFQGWDTDGDGKPDTIPANMPDEGIDAKPVFKANNYTATFDANGGEFPTGATTSKQIPYDSAITADGITEPTREGYTFKGWSRNNSATAGDANLGKMDSTAGVTVYAAWAKNSYTITYDANGGEFANGKDEDVVTCAYGDSIVNHEQPAKDGFSFSGWNWTDANGAITQPSTMPAGNLTATAYYVERHKAIFYRDYENDKTDIASQSMGDVGDPIDEPTTPSKDGYKFIGWYEIDENGVIGNSQVTDFGKYAETDRKFTAKWDNVQGTVTYNANGGTFVDSTNIKSVTANVGTTITAYAEEPQREGYKFLGWSTNASAASADSSLGKVTAAGTTLYAVWQATPHNVTFDANDGMFGDVATFTKGYNYGDTINAPDVDPTRGGYTFKGWAETKDATNALTSLGTMPNSDKTFYAVWVKKVYTVKYYSTDKANPYKTQDYKEGDTIVVPADPSYEGYTFSSWKWYDSKGKELTNAPTAMPADNLEAIAQWTPNKYTIKYDPNGGTIDGKTDVIEYTDCEYNTATPKPADPVKDGMEFAGWNPEYSGTVKGAVTYTAQWIDPTVDGYKVTYLLDDGSTYKVERVKAGVAIPDVTAPTKDGYTFEGWTWSKADGTVIEKPSTMPAEDLTAKATFKKVEEDDDPTLSIFDIIDPVDFGNFVDSVVDYISGIKIDIPGVDDDDKKDDGKDDDKNQGGSNIPNTGSATGIVVFATISGAAAAAYVFTKKKKDDDDED